MQMETIRDAHGKIIGRLEIRETTTVLRDGHGKILGNYDKNSNLTRDEHGKIIGPGNQLMRLLV